jgi:hypothetical protein
MAKSIRSKSMRKNRTMLRKTLSEPAALKRQEKLANDIKVKVEEKAGGSIIALKGLFKRNESTKIVADGDDEEEDDEEETDGGLPFPKPSLKGGKLSVKEKFKLRKEAKARKNPDKKLEWF